RLADTRRDVALRHALVERLHRRADRGEGDVVRALHEGDLGGRLDHAAARGDRRRDDELRLRKLLSNTVEDEEANALLERDLTRRGAAIAHDLHDELVGALVLLPRANVDRVLDQLARARLLESGRHPRELTLRRDDDAERSLAISPPNTGVVEHARAALEEHGRDAVVGHELSCLLDPRAT